MNTANLKGLMVGSLTAVFVIIVSWPVIASYNNNPTVGFETVNQHTTIVQAFGGGSPLVIPAAAFTADGLNPESSFFPFGGGYFQGNTENYGCRVAPVYLPNEAEINEMFVSLYDNDPSYNITIKLYRVDNFTGSVVTMGTVGTSGSDAFAGIQVLNDDTLSEPLVLYPDYSYYLTTCALSSNIRLYSVRLYYTVPSEVYLPMIIK